METGSLEWRLQAMFKLMKFDFGSLWFVGEDIWAKKLPGNYVPRDDRVNHPGICLGLEFQGYRIHSAIKMWHGTTPKSKKDWWLISAGKRFSLKNFCNEVERGEVEHITSFGHFSAVPVDIDYIGSEPIIETDFGEELPQKSKQSKERMIASKKKKLRSIIIPNDTGRKMTAEELLLLRKFIREFYAIG